MVVRDAFKVPIAWKSITWYVLSDADNILHLVQVGDADGLVITLLVHLTELEQLGREIAG